MSQTVHDLTEPREIEDEVLAALRVLSDRGLVRIEWEGLAPVGVMASDLILIHIAADQPPGKGGQNADADLPAQ